MGAEPAMGLRQLDADGAAADHDEMRGQGAVGEDGFVGEIGRFGEAGDRRRHGTRAGCQYDAARLEAIGAGLQLVARNESRLLLQHAHAQAFEALDRIVGRDGRDHTRDMVHHLGEIDLGFDGCDAEGRARALRLGHPGGGDQGLGRHAAEVEAVASHRAALDQHDAETQLRRARRDDEAARAAADDADIGAERGLQDIAHVVLFFRRP